MMRRFTIAVALLAGAVLLPLAWPARSASAATLSSTLTATPGVVREGETVTLTASRLLDAAGAPVTSGLVTIQISPTSPFAIPTLLSTSCPFYDLRVGDASYSCQYKVPDGSIDGFWSAGLVYVPASNGEDVAAGSVDFGVIPPRIGTTTTVTAPSPLTASGGTLTATITHSDGSIISPLGTLDFTEGSTTFCSQVSVLELTTSNDIGTADCTVGALSPGSHHITVTYSGDNRYAGSSGSLDVTVFDPLVISTTALSAGQVGVPYTSTLTATGGTGSVHWSLAAGQSLPAGVTLDDGGTLSGTPTGPSWSGSVGFVVTDSASSASVRLPLTIKPAIRPAVTGLSPTSGPAAGGTLVTLRGKNLDHAVRVTVGGKAVAFTLAPDGLSLTLLTPRHAPGKVAIVVYGAGSTKSSIAFAFHR